MAIITITKIVMIVVIKLILINASHQIDMIMSARTCAGPPAAPRRPQLQKAVPLAEVGGLSM